MVVTSKDTKISDYVNTPKIVVSDSTVLSPVTEEMLQGTKYSKEDFDGVLISEKELFGVAKELAQEIIAQYSPKDTHILWIKEGAKSFFDDVYSHLPQTGSGRFSYEGIKVSSYKGTKSGELTIEDFDYSSIKGKKVLLVEDIVDTGKTAVDLEEKLLSEGAVSVSMLALTVKRTSKSNGYKPLHSGIEIPEKFIVGKGLDYNQEFRGLPFIAVISQTGIEKYNV